MTWSFRDGEPIYRQLVQKIEVMIVSGQYKPGDKMPSVRELALEAGVNPNTMQRAMAELESKGLLRTERTNGRFVTEEENVLKETRTDLATGYIRELFESLEALGMKREDIIEAVSTWNGEVK